MDAPSPTSAGGMDFKVTSGGHVYRRGDGQLSERQLEDTGEEAEFGSNCEQRPDQTQMRVSVEFHPEDLSRAGTSASNRKRLNTVSLSCGISEKKMIQEHAGYHEAITGQEAEERLRKHGGYCYLTRFSNTRECYVLSVYNGKATKHFQIVIEDDGRHRIEGKEAVFQDIESLLKHYEQNRIDPGLKSIGQVYTVQEYQWSLIRLLTTIQGVDFDINHIHSVCTTTCSEPDVATQYFSFKELKPLQVFSSDQKRQMASRDYSRDRGSSSDDVEEEYNQRNWNIPQEDQAQSESDSDCEQRQESMTMHEPGVERTTVINRESEFMGTVSLSPGIDERNMMQEHDGYHEEITGLKAERRLRKRGGNCYLTRFCKKRGCYVLSVYNGKVTQHFRIVIEDNGQHKIDGKAAGFQDIKSLLRHYEQKRINPGLKSIGQAYTLEEYYQFKHEQQKCKTQ